MSLQDLPPELVERIVVLLSLSDICSLRLANRHLASTTTQKHFKARFRTKRVQITEQQLSSFVVVTASGGLGCLLQDLTLVAPVYNTLELTSRLEEKAANFAELDDDGQFVRLNFRDLTEDEVRQARLDLVVLQERCAAQVDMIRHQRDVTLLRQALSNFAAHGVPLEMLRLEVEIYKDDTTTPLLPLFEGNWKPIWTSAANAVHTLFASLVACDLPIRCMELFNTTRMLRCSLSCDELNNVDFTSVRLGASLGHLKELSLRVSDRIINRSSDEGSVAQLTQVTDFQGVRSLLRTCPNILKLNLAHLSVKYNDDSRSILRALAESSLPCIQSLTLQGFSGITEEELLELLQGFETLQSLSLRYVRLRDGSFQPILDYCTMDADMRELDLNDLVESRIVQFEPLWAVQPSVPRTSFAGYPNAGASYRRTSDGAAGRQIKCHVRQRRTLDAGYIRSWRQDLRNRFGPLIENGKSSCLQPYVAPEQTWRY